MADLIPLARAHCVPRKGSDHKLGEARVAELLSQVPGWSWPNTAWRSPAPSASTTTTEPWRS